MAHANKRISIVLAIVAFLFILTIILLIIPYEGTSYEGAPSSDSHKGKEKTPTSTSITSTTLEKGLTSTSDPSMTTKSSTTFNPTFLQDRDDTTSEASTNIHSTTDTNTKTSRTQSSESDQGTEITTVNSSMESTSVSTEKIIFMSSESSTDSDQRTNVTTTDSTVVSDQPTDITATSESTMVSDQATNITTTDSTVESNQTTNITTDFTVESDQTTSITTKYSTLESDQVTNITTTDSIVESDQATNITTTDSTLESDQTTNITTPYSTVESTSVSTVKSISKTASSKQVAARMLHLMNHSADPCQDFYEYSCGNGVDNPYLSPVNPKDAALNRIKDAVFSSSVDNPVHVLYESCLDKTNPSEEKRIDYIRNLVLNLGEFDPRPALPKDNQSSYDYIDNKPFSLTTVFATMMKHHFTPFFDLTLDIDDSASQFILKLTPPLFHSPLTENVRKFTCLKIYYQKMDESSTIDLEELYEDYNNCSAGAGAGISDFVTSTSKSIRKMKLLENVTEVYRHKLENNSIPFSLSDQYAEYDGEEAILQLLPKPSDLRRSLLNRDYTLYTLEQMDNGDGDFPLQLQNFSWHGFVKELLEIDVPVATSVQVYFPEEISNVFYDLNYYLDEADESQKLRNVILAMWSQYLDSNILEPLGHTPHTEEYCLHVVTELLPDVTTQLYLSTFDPDTLKTQMTKVNNMAKSIKAALKSRISSENGHLEKEIIQKIDSMNFVIGEKLFDDYLVSDNIYPMGPLSKTDFPRNVIQLLKRSRSILYSFLYKDPNTTSIMWQHSNLPYSTSGSTLYPLNTVLIPIGIVESPFYEHGVPDIINYAGLGKILSQEMMHAFDSTGVKFDFSSSLDVSNMVTSSEKCQKNQLNNLHTLKINGILADVSLPTDLIVNEALSDSSSVLLAWRAYLTSTKDEMSEAEHSASTGVKIKDSDTQLSDVYEENTTYNVEILPLMDSDTLKQFYIRSAQVHCEKNSQINIMNLKENEHLPGSLRVNHMAKNDPLFKQAFHCENDTPMIEEPQCSYIPLNDS